MIAPSTNSRRTKLPLSPSATASTWRPSRKRAGPTSSTAGGPRGFLKVVDEKTLAFADYRGNRQYISVGNLAADDRAALILMDYAGRARLKIYAHIKAVPLDADPALAQLVAEPGYRAKPERILLLHLIAFDWNCPQHITPRFTEAEISQAVQPLRERLTTLEAENAELRAKLAAKESVE